jgi:phosphoglycolate phosphatase/pyrophosphatase PpaX
VSVAYRLFVFNLDGTVADASDCVVASFAAALARHRIPAVDHGAVIGRVGLPLSQVFCELTDNAYEDDRYGQLVADYRSAYRRLLPHNTNAFPGTHAVLKYLTGKQAVYTIATGKKTEFALASARHVGLDGYFTCCVGDDLGQPPQAAPGDARTHPRRDGNRRGKCGDGWRCGYRYRDGAIR